MSLKNLYIEPTSLSPEIIFSPDKNQFILRGNSAPEDVRALYYPVIEWMKIFVDDVIEGEFKGFNAVNPVKLNVDLHYFNSSSAKFIYDIFMELKRLSDKSIPVIVDWYYDTEDLDQKEAGEDIALLAEMKFNYIPKDDQS
jgi:hypothetical protein